MYVLKDKMSIDSFLLKIEDLILSLKGGGNRNVIEAEVAEIIEEYFEEIE